MSSRKRKERRDSVRKEKEEDDGPRTRPEEGNAHDERETTSNELFVEEKKVREEKLL